MKTYITVDDYLSQQPSSTREMLTSLRTLIKKICPDAVESISYGMPAYKFKKKPLIYFAGYEHHIGIYATPTAHNAFADELAWYKQWKGSVQFPLDQPLPMDLIEKMVLFKMKEIEKK